MEKISAACAMAWSIELEKGLRSRKPGDPLESIHMVGPRLKQWIREPQPTMAAYDMYGLVPGEDRLFADAILLRLADAFASGDKDTKFSVIRVFLPIFRYSKERDRPADGIFSNMGEVNRLEFLRRVKVVLAAESVKFRALTLILLGCCAEIAKDVAEIRYAILSTLLSSHVLEVKASLFAAGCFSEISDDFGSVFLDRLLTLMNSSKTLPALRIVGARTFSKMGCSILLAMKSYKAGAELVSNSVDEDILVTMLISLSKLSLKASTLITEQVGLLSSFLAQRTSSHVQATVLRCMHDICGEAACLLPISNFPFKILLRLLDELNMPSALHYKVLQILLKLVVYGLPDMLDIEEFKKLLIYVVDATRSTIISTKLLAFQILVSVSMKLKGRDDLMLEVNALTIPTGVISTIIDQITLLARLVPGGISSSEVERELGCMLKLLLLLAKNHPELGYVILDKLHSVIKNIENSENTPSAAIKDSEIHKVTGARQNFLIGLFMFYVYRFLVVFLETMDDSGAITNEIVCKLKQLVSFVCDNGLFDCSTHTFFALLLHSFVNWRLLPSENWSCKSVQGLSGSPCKWLENEALILGCAENMLAGGENWCAYKAGRYAACEGEWCVASFIFKHLEARIQSDICCQWLKFLYHFTHFEKNVKVLLLQVPYCFPLDQVFVPSAVDHGPMVPFSSEYIGKLRCSFGDVSSCDKVLEAIALQTQTFCFQRWFLELRLKVLHVLVDVLELLNGFPISENVQDSNKNTGGSDVTHGDSLFQKMKEIMSSLVGVSTRLASVAKEYDLLSTSFVDLDSNSLRVISDLAFSCSLLAFCTVFTSLIKSPVFSDMINESGYCQSVIIEDLAVRLRHIDFETCMDLMSLLKEFQVNDRSLHLLPGFQLSKVGHVSGDILTLCRSSVRQLIGLRNKCSSLENEDRVWQVYKDNMLILSNIFGAWMHIPSRVPKYFFRVRPTVGSLLISRGSGSRKQNETSVLQGSHLTLNLCIQLKNVASDVCSRFSKIYCILSCKISFLGRTHNRRNCGGWMKGYQALEMDTMIDLNKKLQRHVMKQTREFMNCGDHQNDCDIAETYVCFSTNGRAQGLSTCLLDISSFPVGTYQIQWHSGGVDHHGAYWSFLPLSPCPQFTVT